MDTTTNRKRKRRKIDGCSYQSRWRSEGEQQIYSTKLLDALRQIRRAAPSKHRAVRDAANRILAAAARGRTRWSRAILLSSRRRSLKLKAASRRPRPGAARRPCSIWAETTPRPLPELERKAAVLGRLVPGCRKLPFPALLDETSDYIAALQMQVRVMSALVEIIASAGVPSPEPMGSG